MLGGVCIAKHTYMHAYIYTHIYNEVNFNAWHGVCIKSIHTRMHAHIYTHVDASVKSRQS